MIDENEDSNRVAFEEAYYDLVGKIRDLLKLPSTSRNIAVASPALLNLTDATVTSR